MADEKRDFEEHMTIGRVKASAFARAMRRDNLRAMDLLPDGVELTSVGRLPFVIAQGPATVHQVLVSDAGSFRKPWVVRQVIVDGLGENLFTLDSERWLARRKPIAPVFGLGNLDALSALMLDAIEEAATSWGPGEIDIQAAMTDLTLRVALRGLLGVDDQTEALASEVRLAFEEILDWINYRFTEPLSPPTIVPSRRNRGLKRSKGKLQEAVRLLIAHRRTHGTESVDILGQLLLAQRQGCGELTDDAIVDECIGFMFAGHETTASTLTWALYQLSLDPVLRSEVAAEGARLDAASLGLADTLKQMPTTEAVLRETLRMYPAGISIARSAKQRTELAGRKIRKGTLIMIPVYAIQRSAQLWDNPNTFDPTRDHEVQPGYLPFGLGPRRCLGARFARTEMQIALARICARWELSYHVAEPPRLVTAPSLRAEGSLNLTLS